MTDSVKPEKLYVTLGGEGTATIEEKRSEFIGYAAHVQDETEAQSFVRRIKAKHHDARHNVYAYVLGDTVQRYSDDGEPQGTAGIPVLDVIRKSGVTDACIVVTRYFGGILLGTGGLVRAYTQATQAGIAAAEIMRISRCIDVLIEVPYSLYEQAQRLASQHGAQTVDADFAAQVALTFRMLDGTQEPFETALTELVRGQCPIIESDPYDAPFAVPGQADSSAPDAAPNLT